MNKTKIIGFVLLSILSSCKYVMDTTYSITVYNKSDRIIYVTFGYNIYDMYSYPDTVLPNYKPILKSVSPNKHVFFDADFEWSAIISKLPSDTLSVYIFDSDTLKNNDWNKIKEGYKISKRYDLSLEDLEKTNWTITYPN